MGNDPPDHRFTALYRAECRRVLRFVTRRVERQNAAEDIAAEVFQIAWDKMVHGTEPSSGWLFVTARNLVSNYRRSQQRGEDAYRRAAAGSSAGSVSPDVADRVSDTLARLPEAQRDILIYRYWDDLDISEIAALAEVSASAVWVRLHRARQAFKRLFIDSKEAGYAHR
jgi:RNA polymerase sigma factor (sigma-70 family)